MTDKPLLDARERLKLLAALDEAEAMRQYLGRQQAADSRSRLRHCSALVGTLRRMLRENAGPAPGV